ncbi:MAG: L-serine ammonia-lyase, iron-sulfur-dependent, subunit alpha, partial [Oscillospiraceae bacterium]
LTAFKDGEEIGRERIYSVGGGSYEVKGEPRNAPQDIYKLNSFTEIREYCTHKNIRIWQYVEEAEGKEIWDYLFLVWNRMKDSISRGLSTTGILQGGLNTQRKANYLFNRRHIDESERTRENRLVCAYAFAVCEENASGGEIVTAPTCGASGVVPSTLKYMQEKKGFTDEEIIHALATGGIIGNLIKTNASISGAECGCQAEVGTACSMAAAALAELFFMGLGQIEYAAEVSMEHHLGLTCDPIGGLVQIPCIERNAVAAMRSINSLNLSNFLAELQKVSFDTVVKTMYETGKHINSDYRETSQGGLAKFYEGKRHE